MIGRRIRRVVRGLTLLLLIAVSGVAILVLVLRATNPDVTRRPGWQLGADMPLARGEVAAASVSHQFVVAGGLRGLTTTSRDVSVYDTTKNEWSGGRRLPAGRHHAAAAALNGRIYVSGGASGVADWEPRANLWSSRPGSEWRVLAPMPEGRQGHAMVSFGSRLYVIGGVGRTDRTLIYDPSSDRWTAAASLPGGRDHLRAAAWNEEIWVLGGRNGSPTRRVDVYEPQRDRWKRGPSLPEPMSAMAVGVLDGRLHVVGGEDPGLIGGRVTASHVALGRPGGRWATWQPSLLPVHGAGFGVRNDNLLVAGGASRPGALSTISWTEVTQVFGGRRDVSGRED